MGNNQLHGKESPVRSYIRSSLFTAWISRSLLINKSTRIGQEPSRYSCQTSRLHQTSFSSTFTATWKLSCQSIATFIFCKDIVVPPPSSIAHTVLYLYYFLKNFQPNGQKIRRSIRMNCRNFIIAQNTLKNELIFFKTRKFSFQISNIFILIPDFPATSYWEDVS